MEHFYQSTINVLHDLYYPMFDAWNMAGSVSADSSLLAQVELFFQYLSFINNTDVFPVHFQVAVVTMLVSGGVNTLIRIIRTILGVIPFA